MNGRSSATALILFALIPHSIRAATIQIPSEQPTLEAGLAAAAVGDTLLVACGTYFERSLDFYQAVVLRSETGSPDCVTVDAQGARTLVINSGSATLIEGITFVGGVSTSGGAISCGDTPVVFRTCRFETNEATRGGAVASFGTGTVGPTFESCSFTDNFGAFEGGAVWIAGGWGRFVDCVFTRNRASFGAAIDIGAPALPVEIEGCTFVEHTQGEATVSVSSGPAIITRSIIAYGAIEPVTCVSGGTATLSCSNLFGNLPGDYIGCVAGQNGVSGNFSADPLFCDWANGDFTLDQASPCLPGNHPTGAPCATIGALGPGCAAVGVESGVVSESWGRIKDSFRHR